LVDAGRTLVAPEIAGDVLVSLLRHELLRGTFGDEVDPDVEDVHGWATLANSNVRSHGLRFRACVQPGSNHRRSRSRSSSTSTSKIPAPARCGCGCRTAACAI